MDDRIMKRLANLLSVKLLVTLVFAYMAVAGRISQGFMTVYAVVISFYFGSQSQKRQDLMDTSKDTGKEPEADGD